MFLEAGGLVVDKPWASIDEQINILTRRGLLDAGDYAASYLLSAITGFRDTPTRCASQLPKAHLGGV